jgi:cation:H+ antiporter
MEKLLISLEFLVALGVVAMAGSQLSRWGDVIAVKTGLGGTWVGLFLLATVTSLPELITGVSAVALAESADIAVGAILGSCVFNLAILVVLDYLLGRESVYSRVSRSHLLSAGFGVILIGIVGFSLMLERTEFGLSFGHVGISTPIIFVVYIMAVRSVYVRETNGESQAAAEEEAEVEAEAGAVAKVAAFPAMTVYGRFGLAAIVVVGTGLWLPFVGERMAGVFGMQETFVGTFFIAFATSVPELVVAIAAVRIGAPNMAVSNLLGSNLFNILIFVPEDLLYTAGPILASASPVHAISALSAMMMTGIAMVALLSHTYGRRLGGVSGLLLSIYLINSALVYLYRG